MVHAKSRSMRDLSISPQLSRGSPMPQGQNETGYPPWRNFRGQTSSQPGTTATTSTSFRSPQSCSDLPPLGGKAVAVPSTVLFGSPSRRGGLTIARKCFRGGRRQGAGLPLPPPVLGSFQSPLAGDFARSQSLVQGQRILVAVVRIFLQTALNDPLQIGGHCFLELLKGNERFV